MTEIRQEMQLLERTQEYEPKYDLWPYKRWNTGGSITKNYRCIDLTLMHICTKFERKPSRNVACRAHRFPPKYDIWPYKRQNTGGSITKMNRCVDFTKIHLQTKDDRNPSRNAAVRAHTRNFHQSVTYVQPTGQPTRQKKWSHSLSQNIVQTRQKVYGRRTGMEAIPIAHLKTLAQVR